MTAMKPTTFLITAVLLLPLGTGCHHQTAQEKTDEQLHPGETDEERADRHRREGETSHKQAADQQRFHKALAVIGTVKVGDSYNDFYHKATQARLSLEHVTDTADGRVERYAFMDNSTAFVTVVVKADHVTEIRMEGVGR